MKPSNRQGSRNGAPEYKREDYLAFAYAVGSAYVQRETERTFRHFQKSVDRQIARLLSDAKR
jgi:hypothetical protein